MKPWLLLDSWLTGFLQELVLLGSCSCHLGQKYTGIPAFVHMSSHQLDLFYIVIPSPVHTIPSVSIKDKYTIGRGQILLE